MKYTVMIYGMLHAKVTRTKENNIMNMVTCKKH